MNREDREEAMRDEFESRRREFLRDFGFMGLREIIGNGNYYEIREKHLTDDGEDIINLEKFKEELIDYIIEGYLDKEINEEVK